MKIDEKYQDQELMREMLERSKTIAVVGLSDKPHRSSYGVSEHLQKFYRIIPVNPRVEKVLGEKSYPKLQDVPEDIEIDIVNIFRKSEDVLEVVQDAVQRGAKYIFMQQGVVNQEAANLAEAHGMKVIMDSCLAVAHSTLMKG